MESTSRRRNEKADVARLLQSELTIAGIVSALRNFLMICSGECRFRFKEVKEMARLLLTDDKWGSIAHFSQSGVNGPATTRSPDDIQRHPVDSSHRGDLAEEFRRWQTEWRLFN